MSRRKSLALSPLLPFVRRFRWKSASKEMYLIWGTFAEDVVFDQGKGKGRQSLVTCVGECAAGVKEGGQMQSAAGPASGANVKPSAVIDTFVRRTKGRRRGSPKGHHFCSPIPLEIGLTLL